MDNYADWSTRNLTGIFSNAYMQKGINSLNASSLS